jgi:hypothetical protein
VPPAHNDFDEPIKLIVSGEKGENKWVENGADGLNFGMYDALFCRMPLRKTTKRSTRSFHSIPRAVLYNIICRLGSGSRL